MQSIYDKETIHKKKRMERVPKKCFLAVHSNKNSRPMNKIVFFQNVYNTVYMRTQDRPKYIHQFFLVNQMTTHPNEQSS